jgi:amino acid transporter
MILASASITHPDYIPADYHTFLLTTLIMVIHACISSMPTRWIAELNSYGSSFNIIALFVVIVIIPASVTRESQGLPKFTPSSDVWGTIYKGTDWPDGISILLSFLSVIWTMR